MGLVVTGSRSERNLTMLTATRCQAAHGDEQREVTVRRDGIEIGGSTRRAGMQRMLPFLHAVRAQRARTSVTGGSTNVQKCVVAGEACGA